MEEEFYELIDKDAEIESMDTCFVEQLVELGYRRKYGGNSW